jgi:hypothetical protein
MDKSWLVAMGLSAAMWIVALFYLWLGPNGLKPGLPIAATYVIGTVMLYLHCTCDQDKKP